MAGTLAIKLVRHPRRFGVALLETGDAPIVEMSRRDPFGGGSPDGDVPNAITLTGVNALGRILTALSDQLAQNAGDPRAIAQRVWELCQRNPAPEFLINGRPVSLD